MLGDNIFSTSLTVALQQFSKNPQGARVFLKEVSDTQRFGVAEVEGDRIVRITEKPKEPKSNLAVIGVYVYDNRVFDIVRTLKPSGRGDLAPERGLCRLLRRLALKRTGASLAGGQLANGCRRLLHRFRVVFLDCMQCVERRANPSFLDPTVDMVASGVLCRDMVTRHGAVDNTPAKPDGLPGGRGSLRRSPRPRNCVSRSPSGGQLAFPARAGLPRGSVAA